MSNKQVTVEGTAFACARALLFLVTSFTKKSRGGVGVLCAVVCVFDFTAVCVGFVAG